MRPMCPDCAVFMNNKQYNALSKPAKRTMQAAFLGTLGYVFGGPLGGIIGATAGGVAVSKSYWKCPNCGYAKDVWTKS